jgi:hypothetical protein
MVFRACERCRLDLLPLDIIGNKKDVKKGNSYSLFVMSQDIVDSFIVGVMSQDIVDILEPKPDQEI